jgi:hypothetical protein
MLDEHGTTLTDIVGIGRTTALHSVRTPRALSWASARPSRALPTRSR